MLQKLLLLILLTCSLLYAQNHKGDLFKRDSLTLMQIIELNPQSTIKWNLKDPIEKWKKLEWEIIEGELRLTSLDLRDRRVKKLPDAMHNLDQLRYLGLSGNRKLIKLPAAVGQLPHLKKLSLNYTQSLRIIPPGFDSLTHLYAGLTAYKEFTPNSDGTWGFQNLEEVSLYKAYGKKFPKCLAKLPKLKKLDISYPSPYNPPLIECDEGDFPQLDTLIIYGAKKKGLSKISFTFPAVSYVNLSYGKYLDVPYDALSQLKNLKTLILSTTELDSLTASIAKLSSLETLVAKSCSLRVISPEIAKLRELRLLDLYNNRLETLPIEIASMPALNLLKLERNRFESLPTEFSVKFQSAAQLNALYGNPLLYRKSPPFIRELSLKEERRAKSNRYQMYPIHQFGGYPLAYSVELSFTRTDDYEKSRIFRDHGYGGFGFDLSIEPGIHGIRASSGLLFLPFDNSDFSWGNKQFMLRANVLHLWSGENKDKTYAGIELGAQFIGTLRFGIAKEIKGDDIMFTISGGIPAPAILYTLGAIAH